MEGLTVSRFLQILLDAMSQLFFSLSVSMGIMITYGSYVKPDVDLNKAVNQPDYVIDEMQRNGETFRRKKLYRVMIRYVAPVMMLVLFLQSTGILA